MHCGSLLIVFCKYLHLYNQVLHCVSFGIWLMQAVTCNTNVTKLVSKKCGTCVDLLTKSMYAVDSARLVHLCFAHTQYHVEPCKVKHRGSSFVTIMCNHVR